VPEDPTENFNIVRARYDSWHDQVGELYTPDLELDAPWHQAALGYLQTYVPGREVLEIGCGRGAMARCLAGLGADRVMAADFSVSAIRQARQQLNGIANVETSVQDIQDIRLPKESFDTVVSFETIEHVPKPELAITELARVLKCGGTLILTTPNYLGITGLFRLYKRITGNPYTEVGQPINQFVYLPRTARWVRRAGLSISVKTTHGQYIPFPGRDPLRAPCLERLGWISRSTGLHSLIVAHKHCS
jgi:2-polyprenyl-3-methyl-5-hydroxy-6-metoxy-1,4-benzoquinol methylase